MKSFSWTLALRYLNPLRSFASVITLISLLGVAFGVMVLIVTLSVHAGFERNLKEILLGFSPHITVTSKYRELDDWAELEEDLGKDENAESAYALVEGFVLLDSKVWRRPVSFRAFNTANEGQVKALEELLDQDGHPGSSADLGLDDRVVISRQLANALGLTVGDKVRLIAASNLDEVLKAYDAPEKRAWELYPEVFTEFEAKVKVLFKRQGEQELADKTAVTKVYRILQVLIDRNNSDGQLIEGRPMRKKEEALVFEILDVFDSAQPSENETEIYPLGSQDEVLDRLKQLRELDLKEADLEAFKGVEEFVSPKDFEISGVYGDTARAPGPHIFMPLDIGMELKGLENVAESIGILIKDPYSAEEAAGAFQEKLGPEYIVQSWMKTHTAQFQLVKTEKVMMSFILSFLTVLSSFSIMAVMFTVTIQKRQEIGVMKALGARPSQIVRVFVYQGLVVGVLGAVIGLGLGLLAVHNREHIIALLRGVGIDAFPAEFHGMSELPARIVPEHLLIICLVSIVLCLIAALIPALTAAFRDPAKSLRNL